jgi:TonB-linked SusC/RagA family outer membrane protein
MKRKLLFLSVLLLFGVCLVSAQQNLSVSGVVSDANDGTPLVGVSVSVKGTTLGTVTNLDGQYTIKVAQGSTLVFTYIGMEKQEVTVKGSVLNVKMQSDTQVLGEVVAVGYGTMKKKLVTGATVQVKGDDIQRLNTTSALGALQSQTPGVSIVSSNGQPGEGFKVTIRGLGTINNSSPLYVIDGITGGDINALNPSDIESIDVLKDAASSAIYGARAANGVILVTTKQGKSGKIQVTYDGFIGWQNVYKKADLLNAQEYMAIQDEIVFNEGDGLNDWEALLGAKTYARLKAGWTGTNWFDEITVKNAPTTNHAINVVGGGDISKFSAGFSYTNQNGILGAPYASGYERYTARLNSDHVILKANNRDVIKIGENLTFNYSEKNGVGQGNLYWNDIHNVLSASPLLPAYNDKGGYYTQDDKNADSWNQSGSLGNPILELASIRGQNLSRNFGLNANAYLVIEPIKNLKYRSQFGYRLSANTYRSLTIPYKSSTTSSSADYSVNQSAGMGHNIAVENTLSYALPQISNHNIDVLVGQSFEKVAKGESVGVTNTVKGSEALPTLTDFDHAWIKNTTNVNSSTLSGEPWGESALVSFFGRLNWNYKETYMATLILRADGSSNFARNNRWGYFPSASAGWVISNESWAQSTKTWLDFFKLRASWGQNGNCAIANFQYVASVAFDQYNVYSFGPTSLGTTDAKKPGGYAKNLPNPDVTWETSEQSNFGFDARFLNSRLGLNMDYYVKKTKNWLIAAPILATAGTGAPVINGGDVQNSGIEVVANWNDRIGKDFHYAVNANIAFNKNEVLRIANSEKIIHGQANVLSQGTTEMYRAQVGYPIGYFWGYKTDGVFQNQQEINDWLDAGKPVLQTSPKAGDLKFVDNDGNGVLNEKDKTQIGDPHPDVNVGFGINLDYKGFDLSVAAAGAFGQQIAKSYRSFADSRYNNYTTDIFGRWHGEGTSNRLPRLSDGSNTNWQEISDIYIEDAGYLRIQSVALGYDFKKLIKNLPLSQARVYVQAQNLYTFTKYTGMDPEVGYGFGDSYASGIDLGSYPNPRTILIGVNLKF